MNKKPSKKLIATISLMALAIIAFCIYWVMMLNRAHSTFDNYYNFRSCQNLLSKSDDSAVCQTKSGDTIKLVKFQDRWFLDGDLPCGFMCF